MTSLMRCPFCGRIQDEPVGIKTCSACGGELVYVNPPKPVSKRLILKYIFLFNNVRTDPDFKQINLELCKNGVILFHLDKPNQNEAEIKYTFTLDWKLTQMNNNLFDALIINGKMNFLGPKEEIHKIESYKVSDLVIMPSFGSVADNHFEGGDLYIPDSLTFDYEMQLTQDIKNEFLGLIGFQKDDNQSPTKRLVFRGAYYHDPNAWFGKDGYCNLELFQNGYRIFHKSGDDLSMNPEGRITERKLVPFPNGNFTVLIFTNLYNGKYSKSYYLISNQEANEFQNIDREKDLYKLLPDVDLPDSYNSFEGQGLVITPGGNVFIPSNVVNEFQRFIQNS